MRAIYIGMNTPTEDHYLVDTQNANHLIKVLRIKLDSELLLLDGLGTKYISRVVSIAKKELVVKIINHQFHERLLSANISVALSLPKKDAFQEMLKQSTEMGINDIYPIKTKYSQIDLLKDEKFLPKISKFLESSVCQSNNLYLPSVHKQLDLPKLLEISTQFDKIIYLSSHKIENDPLDKDIKLKECGKVLIIIGPEGGLDSDEEASISMLKNSSSLHLPTYIMRAPTALNVAVGYLLGKMS